MQFGRPRLAEQPVPGVGADPHHAGQIALDIAEADRADQAGRSPQNDRIAALFAAPGLTVTTRKIAARVKSCTTSWDTGAGPDAVTGPASFVAPCYKKPFVTCLICICAGLPCRLNASSP